MKVYLPNGQECVLLEELGGRYLVQKLLGVYEDENWQEDILSDEILVNKVYFVKPIEKIDEEVKELLSVKETLLKEINTLKIEKVGLTHDISTLNKTRVDNEKFLINKSELLKAKSLVLFPKDQVMPLMRDSSDKSFRGIKVSFEIEVSSQEEHSWGYKLRWDYDSHSSCLYPDNGILVDPTPEEVEERIAKRLTEQKWEPFKLRYVADKYLSESQKSEKYAYIEEQEEKAFVNAAKRLKELEAEIARLNGTSFPESELPYPA